MSRSIQPLQEADDPPDAGGRSLCGRRDHRGFRLALEPGLELSLCVSRRLIRWATPVVGAAVGFGVYHWFPWVL